MKEQLKKALLVLQNNAKQKTGDEARRLVNSIQSIIDEIEEMNEISPDELDALKTAVAELEGKVLTVEEFENKIHEFKMELKNDFKGGAKKNAYLDTHQATKDFMNSIVGAGDGKKASQRWREHLIKNAVTGIAYPTEIIAGIFHKWEELDDLLTHIPKVSTHGCKLVYTEQDQFDLDRFAKGHTAGNSKIPSTLELKNKAIDLQFAYDDQVIDRIDLQKMSDGSDTALINFVIEQGAINLRESIIYTILFGNAHQTTAGQKITTLEAIAPKVSTDAFTVVATLNDENALIDEIVAVVDSLKADKLWMYVSKATRSALRRTVHASGGTPSYQPISVVADSIGVERIETIAMPEGIVAVFIDPTEYRRAGGEMFGEDWTIFEKNQEAFRSEIAIGGAIGGLLSTAVLKDT